MNETSGPWTQIDLDTTGVTDKAELMNRLAAAFALPDWFGRNWDALADCLSDLPHEAGVRIHWMGAQDLPSALRDPLEDILTERVEQGPTTFQVLRLDET